MKVLIAHPGTQYSHQLVKQLHEAGMLYQFHTNFALSEQSLITVMSKYLPITIRRKISNRIIKNIPKNKLKTQFLNEGMALYQLYRGLDKESVFFERNKNFQEQIPEKVIIESDVVIGFDTSSWILAQRCKNLGKPFILDVSIAHPRSKQKIFEKILRDFPEWQFSLPTKKDELIQLEELEFELAEKIVVASSFTQNTLIENGISASKISINPYGVDTDSFHSEPTLEKSPSKINFIFVGLVDARKGVPLLLNAWNDLSLENAELHFVGPIDEKAREMIELSKNVKIWGKVPFRDLPRIFRNQNVSIFPSYFEGFGLVILEAMASGLPVITTSATCGPDIIEEGKEGFLLFPGDYVALIEAIRFFAENPFAISKMGQAASKKASLFTWDAYGKRWENILKNVHESSIKI